MLIHAASYFLPQIWMPVNRIWKLSWDLCSYFEMSHDHRLWNTPTPESTKLKTSHSSCVDPKPLLKWHHKTTMVAIIFSYHAGLTIDLNMQKKKKNINNYVAPAIWMSSGTSAATFWAAISPENPCKVSVILPTNKSWKIIPILREPSRYCTSSLSLTLRNHIRPNASKQHYNLQTYHIEWLIPVTQNPAWPIFCLHYSRIL